MGKGKLDSCQYFSIKYNLPYSFIHFGMKHRMGDITDKAKLRLAFIELYNTLRDVSLVCRIFNISRPTFYKWYNRYNPHNLKTLEDRSKAPHRKRHTTLSLQKEFRIKRLREEYLRLGKDKLKIIYEERYKEPVSYNHIQYVIKKYNLYFDKKKAAQIRIKRDKRRGAKKIRINKVNPKDYITRERPFFFCVDNITLYLSGGLKRYIFTAVDYFKKFAYARCYKSKKARNAYDFLLRLMILVDGKVAAILIDNGSEFEAEFRKACEQLKIPRFFTRVRTPKDNSINERFNRTLQEEFLSVNEYFEPSLGESDLTEANQLLTRWLIHYNFERPHQSLGYKRPMEYTAETVLTMSPSRTNS